jgi:hypothetical protein
MASTAHDIKLWPGRLVDAMDKKADETCTCYWVLGLPTYHPSDLAILNGACASGRLGSKTRV